MRQVLLETYDEANGIQMYDSQSVGVDYIAMLEAEDANQFSLLYESIDRFANSQVGRIFKTDYTSFMELPRDICEKMYAAASKATKTQNAAFNNALNELNDDD